MLYAVEPTLASELDRGAIVRGGCRNLHVTKVTTSNHRVHITGFPHYDDADLLDLEEHLTFEPVSLMLTEDVDCWEPDDGVSNRIRIKALTWKEN